MLKVLIMLSFFIGGYSNANERPSLLEDGIIEQYYVSCSCSGHQDGTGGYMELIGQRVTVYKFGPDEIEENESYITGWSIGFSRNSWDRSGDKCFEAMEDYDCRW